MDWVLHLPLVLLGLCLAPKDDTDLSVSEAMFGSPLMVPGEFLHSTELPPATDLGKIERAVAEFLVPPPHHVLRTPPCPLPAALMSAKYMFVREDASVTSLSPLYCKPYLVLERCDKFFCLQLGSRTDVVMVDRLKPVFSADPVSVAVPPASGCPTLWVPTLALPPPDMLALPSAAVPIPALRMTFGSCCFLLLPAAPLWWNSHRVVCDIRTCSALTPLFLLGECCGGSMSVSL